MIVVKKNNNYKIGKDIQYLSDCISVQDQINKNVNKSLKAAGLGMILMSLFGYSVLTIISNIEKRLKKLEDNQNKKTPEIMEE